MDLVIKTRVERYSETLTIHVKAEPQKTLTSQVFQVVFAHDDVITQFCHYDSWLSSLAQHATPSTYTQIFDQGLMIW